MLSVDVPASRAPAPLRRPVGPAPANRLVGVFTRKSSEEGLAAQLPTAHTATLRRLGYYQDKINPARARPFAGVSEPVEFEAADGVLVRGTRLAARTEEPETATHWATVLAHGLFAHRRLPAMMAFAESLARYGPVWTIDLRGHGDSGGECTLGDDEAFDIAAAVGAAQSRDTSLPVATVGLSMGAAAAIRSAALLAPPEAVVAISSPGPWQAPRGFGAWKTSLTWRVPGGTAAVRRLGGFRLAGTTPVGLSPLDVVAQITCPVLIVHGTADPFFSSAEAVALHERAHDPKDLWILAGGGHAESLFSLAGYPSDPAVVDAFADGLMLRLARMVGPTP